MFKPQKTEEEQWSFFRRSYDRFTQAKKCRGEINFWYRIADTTVCLKFAGNSLVPLLTPALEHLRLPDTVIADLTLCIWDSKSTGVEMIPPPCTGDCFTDRGDIWGFDSQRFRIAFHWGEDSVNLMDLEAKVGIFWVKKAGSLPSWSGAFPLRTIFHWWMEKNGCLLLPAAAIGLDQGAVLVTGKGGVGEATTTLSCLQAGFDFLGDEYLVVRLTPEPAVYSLYGTSKLNAAQIEKFPDLAVQLKNPDGFFPEEGIIFLNSFRGKQIVSPMPLRAILTPTITDRRNSAIAPISGWEVQRALSFAVMTQLPNAGHYADTYIRNLIDALPCFMLEIGGDCEDISVAVSALLNDLKCDKLTLPEKYFQRADTGETPLISVIIPVFNGERFIREAVENVLSQHYPALEIIIVNDGSNDRTEEIVTQLPMDFRYFRQSNLGPAAARNHGIRNASGDFIAFLDVDDLWPENNLHSFMEEMLRQPQWDVVRGYGQLIEFDVETKTYKYLCSPPDAFLHFIGAGLYRKTVFEKVGLFDPSLRFAEDADWYMRAEEMGIKMKRLDETRLYVRRHGRNMTEGKNVVELNRLKLIKKYIDRKRSRSGQVI